MDAAVRAAVGLRAWLMEGRGLDVSTRVCAEWLKRDWSASQGICSAQGVEEALGESLRMDQYSKYFGSCSGREELCEVLAESLPSVVVSVSENG